MYSDNWNYATKAVKSDDFSSDFSQVVDSFTEVPRQQLWVTALAGSSLAALPGSRTQRRVLHSEHPPKYSNPLIFDRSGNFTP